MRHLNSGSFPNKSTAGVNLLHIVTENSLSNGIESALSNPKITDSNHSP